MGNKSTFTGQITSIQPRIRLTRSFDEASHTYLGYAIKIAGTIYAEETTFSIGIGKAAQAKFNFKVNDIISGACLPVPDPDMEPVDYYKVSKLAKVAEGDAGQHISSLGIGSAGVGSLSRAGTPETGCQDL
jgi:hypothetical protein